MAHDIRNGQEAIAITELEFVEEKIQDAKRRHLQALDLHGYPIKALPESIGQLSSLQELYLSGTKITALPESIGQLSSLQSLDLNNTQITALPESIGKLSSLQALDLNFTPITALPESIGQLSSLQSLYLYDTQITALPESIGQLSSLKKLYLYDTQITALPESIGQLSSLQELYLCDCHLKSIPYSMVQLGLPFVINDSRAGNCINLTGVTLDEGDLSLFAQPREVIEAYYQKSAGQSSQSAVPDIVRECKVIFLGDGKAGKSSLIDRIKNNHFEKDSLPTDGVKIDKWETKLNGKPFTVRFLDFGGQEIMHAMHRCFLTSHTVYVVVCESRDDAEIDSVAARWLETVKSFAPDCPVILALNKADLNPNVSVNESNLRKRNPKLVEVLRTSAAVKKNAKHGVSALEKAIREQIPVCLNRMEANPDVLGLKQRLEAMTEDWITAKDYRKMCVDCHITDSKLQRSFLGWFKDLGVAYYYKTDDLNTLVDSIRVLNPSWLTNGIYRLILRTPDNGFLSHQTIQDVLQAGSDKDMLPDKVYTPQETDYILHVMRIFEISHKMENGVEMIPMKMSKTPPKSADPENPNGFQRQNALHLRWEGAYLPNNLIHRLIIRKFPELDTECVWRTGGHFWQNKSGNACEALAEMDDNALDVYVIGSRDCRQYMEAFRSEIWNILSGFNLDKSVTEMICYKIDGREGYIPYEDVIQQYYDGMEKIYIPGIKSYISPVKLLQETYVDWKKDAELRGLRDGVVISLADRDEKTPAEKDLERKLTIAQTNQANSETLTNHIRNTALIAAAAVLITLATARPDLLSDLFPQILEFFQGLLG